jgi:hypothetical protein
MANKMANKGQQRPTKANKGQQRPTMANKMANKRLT